jgi:hypothetical protein
VVSDPGSLQQLARERRPVGLIRGFSQGLSAAGSSSRHADHEQRSRRRPPLGSGCATRSSITTALRVAVRAPGSGRAARRTRRRGIASERGNVFVGIETASSRATRAACSAAVTLTFLVLEDSVFADNDVASVLTAGKRGAPQHVRWQG